MQAVFASVVDNIQTPIIVFQKRPSATNDATNLANFRCLVHNRAFSDNVLKGQEINIIGASLFQSFPQLQHTEKVLKPLRNVVSDQIEMRSTTLQAVEYEDMLVDKNVYTIKFCKVDDRTFIMTIDNISDQIRAKILAEDIAQAKEQFVANVSHEIRTPLNGILGYIAMMSDPKETETLTDYQRNCFTQIKECSMNLLYIMNDILDFSKLNADQMQLKEAPFDLSEVLERSYDVVLPSAHEKGIEGAFLIDPNVPPRVKGDFKKLRQVLLNLLSNGVKFTYRGRVDTTVKLAKDEATGEELDVRGRYTLEFCVQDTGIGISKRNQKKLFKAFSQIDQSNKKIYQGTGLGLIISRKLVQLMGGKIWVESEEGEGSRFFFTIKLEEARATSTESHDKWLPLLKDKNVLVVDDHATNRITIASHLVQWGMKPLVCGSAEEALLYIRGGVVNFDLALLDMRMPRMDGNELATKIIQLAPTLPLVAISSTPMGPKDINRNFSFYISKPIKHRQLFNICLTIIKRAKPKDPTGSPPCCPTIPPQRSPVAARPLIGVVEDFTSLPIDPELSSKYSHLYSSIPEPCKQPNRSFLIAEDLYTNQRVAIGFLEKLGFKDFTVAEDGLETLEKVEKRHFDVILMDLKMPRLDGYQTTKRIRQLYKTKRKHQRQPFIIALTANAMGGVREKCAEAGMDAYVSKPIDMAELASILNDAC
jgi:signal transduction histidine kinase/CheY-like chemotaxis protein